MGMFKWVGFNNKFMCSKIDNKSEWCSQKKNYLCIVCGIYLVPGILNCNTLPSFRQHKIIIYLLFYQYDESWSTKNSLLLFFYHRKRSILNCLFCSLSLSLVDKREFISCGAQSWLGKLKSIAKCNWNMLWTLIMMFSASSKENFRS